MCHLVPLPEEGDIIVSGLFVIFIYRFEICFNMWLDVIRECDFLTCWKEMLLSQNSDLKNMHSFKHRC